MIGGEGMRLRLNLFLPLYYIQELHTIKREGIKWNF